MPEDLDLIDAALADKLARIAPPPGLRARLLALEPQPAERVSPWWGRGISAAAAAVLLFCGLAGMAVPQPRGAMIADASRDLAGFLARPFDLPMVTSDMGAVRDWLARNGGKMPAFARNETPLGCRPMRWRGRAGSLVCFQLPGGDEAHLFLFPDRAFGPQMNAAPRLARVDGWMRAAWTANGSTYLLFAPGRGALRAILSDAGQRETKIASSSVFRKAWVAAKDSSGRPRISSPG